MLYEINPPIIYLNRTLQLYGEINFESISKLQSDLIDLCKEGNNNWVTLFISSFGGIVSAGFAFCDFIKITNIRLITVALGTIASMSLPIFLVGQHRIMGALADIAVHNLSVTDDDEKDVDDVKKLINDLKKMQDNYIKIVLEKSQSPMTEILLRNLLKEKRVISPEQALKFGWIHEIIE